jgi:hypothetical protein
LEEVEKVGKAWKNKRQTHEKAAVTEGAEPLGEPRAVRE